LKKYYFLAELLIVEYRHIEFSVCNFVLDFGLTYWFIEGVLDYSAGPALELSRLGC